MTLLQSGLAKSLAADAYTIDNSCRFDYARDTRLTWTPASAGNRKLWTFSYWFKPATVPAAGGETHSFTADNMASQNGWFEYVRFTPADGKVQWQVVQSSGSGKEGKIKPSMTFNDPSAWYHMVCRYDSANASAGDRMRMWVNGDEVTDFSEDTQPAQDHDSMYFNNDKLQCLGNAYDSTAGQWNAYMAEVYFIDGQGLGADSFGETDSDTNQWIPIDASGLTFGTNGYYLKFQDSAALGDDSSGNTNDFTVDNLVATDQMIDTPTNNFCTINPVDSTAAVTFSEGNLQAYYTTWTSRCNTTFACPTAGKWYMETCGILDTYGNYVFGGGNSSLNDPGWTRPAGYMTGGDWGLWGDSGAMVSYVDGGTTHTLTGLGWAGSDAGTVIAIAYDADNNGLWYSRDGVWIDASGGSASSATVLAEVGTSGTTYRLFTGSPIGDSNMVFSCSPSRSALTSKIGLNFGQDSSFAGTLTAASNADSNGIGEFKYPVPDGFLALCTDNLSDPEIALPGENFNTVLWTGDDTIEPRAFTGVGFQPDLVWDKIRSAGYGYHLWDSVRGVENNWASDSSDAQVNQNTSGYVTTFGSDGFTYTIGSSNNYNYGLNTETYVAWNWKAGGAPTADNVAGVGAVPTAGSVIIDGSNLGSALAGTVAAKRMSANTTSGFSITEYDGNSITGATVAHGLGVAPDMVILKQKGTSGTYAYTGSNRTDGWDAPVILSLTGGGYDDSGYFNDAAPSSSVITLGHYADVNGTGMIAYCFASIEGYSKVGVYTGTLAVNGPFAHTGFSPAWIMWKPIAAADWTICDNKRNTYNAVADRTLNPNLSSAEHDGSMDFDFLSNGFKIRNANSDNNHNTPILYLAFAKSPFKTANAR